jgi:osmotically-inducible protein OsmY
MSTATLTDKDLRLRDAVLQQLEWDPAVDASAIGVAARAGAVTLTGSIGTYAGKLAAERAAKRVHGVRAIANDLEVRLRIGRSDADIAADAATALRLHGSVPNSVQAAVHHGHVTLTGVVAWLFQKLVAEKAVRHVRGVRHLANHIRVLPQAEEREARRRITQALHRHADLDARHIDVSVGDGVVHLTGTASSWAEREIAERAAGDAPGIMRVENLIVVEPPARPADAADEMC